MVYPSRERKKALAIDVENSLNRQRVHLSNGKNVFPPFLNAEKRETCAGSKVSKKKRKMKVFFYLTLSPIVEKLLLAIVHVY